MHPMTCNAPTGWYPLVGREAMGRRQLQPSLGIGEEAKAPWATRAEPSRTNATAGGGAAVHGAARAMTSACMSAHAAPVHVGRKRDSAMLQHLRRAVQPCALRRWRSPHGEASQDQVREDYTCSAYSRAHVHALVKPWLVRVALHRNVHCSLCKGLACCRNSTQTMAASTHVWASTASQSPTRCQAASQA